MQPDRPTRAAFPVTRPSIVAAVQSDDADVRHRAHAVLVEVYWRPVYAYLRLRWRRTPEDAQDLTQDFLATALDKQFLAAYDASRSRLRTFLRVCLDRHVQNADRAARRQKRGGGLRPLSLDFSGAEDSLARIDPADPTQGEALFEREWVRSFFTLVVEDLRRECESQGQALRFRIFERYDLDDEPVSYADLARQLGVPVTDVTNALAAARRAFRRRVLVRLRESAASDDEYRAEVRALLGRDAEAGDDA